MEAKTKKPTPSSYAILLGAGSGERFGSHTPKQFCKLKGKRLYEHTLEALLRSKLFTEIIFVCHPLWVERVRKKIRHPKVKVIAGGPTRQASSLLGLLALPKTAKYVLIHDASRPFVSQEILHSNMEAVGIHKAVDTCIPSADTLVESLDGETITSIPIRKHFLRGQTPQTFSYSVILQAHKKTSQVNATDDCSLVLERGKKVHIVAGSEENFKITTAHDLRLAAKVRLA